MFQWLRSSKASEAVAVPQPLPEHRIYAIGDVHGRDDLLARLLPRLMEDAGQHRDARQPVLVFLGDLVDRGDHSREALDIAIAAQQDWPEVIYLRGNHEAALLDFLADPAKGRAWLGFGGKQTLASYGVAVPKVNAEQDELEQAARALVQAMGDHLPFLQATRLIYQSGDVVFAHSGIDPDRELGLQTEQALLWGRSAFLERSVPSGLRVVHGHWDDPKPVIQPERLCLDTGAYYSGMLTAARLDEGTELIQVDVFDT